MSPNASHRVRPGLSSAASLITTLLISFDQEVLNQHLNLVTPEYPFFESPCLSTEPPMRAGDPDEKQQEGDVDAHHRAGDHGNRKRPEHRRLREEMVRSDAGVWARVEPSLAGVTGLRRG